MKCLISLALISLLVSDTIMVTTQYISSLGIYREKKGREREWRERGGRKGEGPSKSKHIEAVGSMLTFSNCFRFFFASGSDDLHRSAMYSLV